MSEIVLKGLNKIFGSVAAVENVNLNIKDGQFLVLLGPSGCGKTTVLRMIAGLETADSGEIYMDKKIINDVHPKDRDIAMVFQNYALYPHMSVFDNMAFGLKMRKMPKNEIHSRINDAANILSIKELLQRRPGTLSGGQKQRVALGRAIVRNPKVFLMDEPLSNLDAILRIQMRTEIKKLHARLGTTVIYVTHDQMEAMSMGDVIVIMKEGVIQQIGTPMEIYNQPANNFVASFIGSPPINIISGMMKVNNGDGICQCEDFKIQLNQLNLKQKTSSTNQEVLLGVRPEDLKIDFDNNNIPGDAFKGKVRFIEKLGAETLVYVERGNKQGITVRIDNDQPGVGLGEVTVFPELKKIHLFDVKSGKRLN